MAEGRHLVQGFLDPVLPERRDAGRDGGADPLDRHRLGDRNQQHLLGAAAGALGGAGHALADRRQAGADVATTASSIATIPL